MLKLNDKEIKDLESDLKSFTKKAVPFASANGLNKGAFKLRKAAIENVRNEMILRNRWTERSIQVQKAIPRTNVKLQEAVVGSTQDYMEDQEFGTTISSSRKHGVPLPTTVASNEGRSANVRRKLPTPANRMSRINIKRRKGSFVSQKQSMFVQTLLAARSGSKYVFLNTGRKKAIYRVRLTGGRKSRNPKIKMDMIYDLSNRSVRIPRKRWLLPSTNQIAPMMPEFYADALEDQVKRQKLFRKKR